MASRVHNILHHKAEDRALEPNYSRFLLAAIVDSCEDAIISKDLDGIITSWNHAAERLLGYTADEILGRSILTIVPPELQNEEYEILRKLRAGERIEHFETRRRRKDGTLVRVSLTISPVRDDAGRVIGGSKIARDLSERLGAEGVRRRLAAIVESSDDAIIGKDLDGMITSWNQAAERLLGYKAEEIIGRSILTIIPPQLHPEEYEILRKLRAGERIDHYETQRQRKDGTLAEVSLTISPIRDADGHVIGSSKIARDISERKRMQRHLIQSEKLAATGRMAATIAHEINNPLVAIMNLVYLARTSIEGDNKALAYLTTAENELDRVAHIARQTLGFYREPGAAAEVHFEQVVENVLAVYRTRLLTANIAVDCRFSHHRTVFASSGELMQVFSNLVTNAIDAMPQGGTLSFQTRELGAEGLQIVVRDTGTGIATDHLARVFEPFFTTKPSYGTGIGLWVAQQLVEKNRGKISILSSTQPDNHGTAVEIFLPFKKV